MRGRIKPPSPALAVASIALFVALSGTAVAAGVVPLAKRALSADTLKGKAPAAIAAMPGPASSAAGVVSVKTQNDSIGADQYKETSIACDSGRKAISGGFWTDGPVVAMGSRPTGDTAWQAGLLNVGDRAAAATLYVVCIG